MLDMLEQLVPLNDNICMDCPWGVETRSVHPRLERLSPSETGTRRVDKSEHCSAVRRPLVTTAVSSNAWHEEAENPAVRTAPAKNPHAIGAVHRPRRRGSRIRGCNVSVKP